MKQHKGYDKQDKEPSPVFTYPAEEVRQFLTQSDPAVVRTQDGFLIPRSGREPVEYRGPVRDLKILRDGRVAEVFVNGGEEVYTALL